MIKTNKIPYCLKDKRFTRHSLTLEKNFTSQDEKVISINIDGIVFEFYLSAGEKS